MILNKLTFILAFTSPMFDKLTIVIKYRYSRILSTISNINIVFRVHCYIMLMYKLPFLFTFFSPHIDKITITIEFLHSW